MLVLKTTRSPLDAVAFGPSGQTLAAVGGRSTDADVSVWAVTDGRLLGRTGPSPFAQKVLLPVAVEGEDHFVIHKQVHDGRADPGMWLLRAADLSVRRFGIEPAHLTRLCVCPVTGRAVAWQWVSPAYRLAGYGFDPTTGPVRRWAGPTGRYGLMTARFDPDGGPLWTAELTTEPASLLTRTRIRVRHDDATSEETHVTETGYDLRLTARDPDTGDVRSERTGTTPAWGTQFELSPDGGTLAILDGMCVRVVRPGGSPVPPLVNDVRRIFTGLAFHPSGRHLAVTSNDATVKLYDNTSWAVAAAYTWDVGRMRCVAFSPDGTLAAAGSDTGRVVVWDCDL
jgi:hypothetical protein